MDRTGLEMALREAGLGGDRSIALAAELMDESAGPGEEAEESQVRSLGRHLEAWQLIRPELDCDWDGPIAVADADARGDLGDMCGRRVA
jgi:hypothetical protein